MSRRTIRAILFALLPLAGCTIAEPYSPNRPPVPLISHQGELSVSGGLHFPDATGFDYQAVYAAWDNISLYGAFQFDRGWEVSLGGPDSADYNNRFFEIGIGYFDTNLKHAQYEAYLKIGLGTGSEHTYFPFGSTSTSSTDTTRLNVFRIGVQQNIGTEGNFGAIGIGLGIGYEYFYNLNRNSTNYDYVYPDSLAGSTTELESSPHSSFYAEPILFWRFGYKNVKIMQEIWWDFTSSTYSIFKGGNESLTISLDF